MSNELRKALRLLAEEATQTDSWIVIIVGSGCSEHLSYMLEEMRKHARYLRDQVRKLEAQAGGL